MTLPKVMCTGLEPETWSGPLPPSLPGLRVLWPGLESCGPSSVSTVGSLWCGSAWSFASREKTLSRNPLKMQGPHV